MTFHIEMRNDERSITSLMTLMKEYENTVIPEKNMDEINLIYKKSGNVVAGAKARILCGNCFVSMLFVIPQERHLGLGSSLMNEIRSFQLKSNAAFMTLFTRDVDTKRFLDEREMIVDGRIRHCPTSHTLAFYSGTPRFKKVDIYPSYTMKKNVEITEKEFQELRNLIESDSFLRMGSHGFSVAFTILDDEGNINGGLIGSVIDDCMEIKALIVSSSFRKRGYGKRLLESIESFGKEKGIRRIFVRPFCFHDRAIFSHMDYQGFDTPCHGVMSKSLNSR